MSESQAALARERIARDGVADRCSVDVRDYRALPADLTFDKVVSVGMFEHVGRAQLELPVGEEGHTSAPAHTRDRMGDFPSVAFWNWSQPSTDWFNLATGEALAEYNPSPAMRELVAGVESQRADPHLSASTGGIAHITHSTTSNSRVNATQPRETRSSTRVTRSSTLIYARNSRPTTSNSRANTSKTHQSTHADANEKSARKFGDRNCGDGMDGRFDDGILAGSMTGSVTEFQLVKMRAAPVRGARTPCPLT